MRGSRNGLLIGAIALAVSSPTFAGCGGSASSVSDCPSFVVQPDAGVSGFSAVGEWRSDQLCASYCPMSYPVCQLVTPTSVRCQQGCG